MLVLTRKSREAVVIGEPGSFEPVVKVTVLELNGGSVRLGFEADTGVLIHRWEVWERIRAGDRPDSTRGEPVAPVA